LAEQAPPASSTANPDSLLLPDSSRPTFKIPESSLRRPVSLIAYGDMRFTNPAETKPSNPEVRVKIVRQVAKLYPDVLLLSGDVPWHGGDSADYAVYKEETLPWREEHLSVFPALGNHEFENCALAHCLENWWRAFPKLNRRRWYSVQVGTKVYVIALDSDDSLKPGSRQIEWLKSQLDSLPRTIEFVMFVMHHPPVADPDTGVPRPNEIALRDFLAAAAKTVKAKIIVVTAHVHNYERFEHDGIVYVVSGGGGAKPDHVTRTPQDLYKGPQFPNYNYLEFILRGSTLHTRMYRLSAQGKFQPKDVFDLAHK
jgi:3',5'-cyclic AMP phosphodiesterase CpdA